MFDYRAIFSYLRQNFQLRDAFIITSLIVAYVIVRTVNLEILPIFNDEGIYIEWAKIAARDPNWRFISLTDGKQPLQTWLTIPMLKLFPDNYLLAGRLVSVFTGLAALSGVFAVLMLIWNKKAAYIGAVLYILTPYFIFYDRLAMIDSGVNAAFLWILFFGIILARTIRLDVALILGMVAGIGLLAKSSVNMFVALTLFGPVLFVKRNWKKQIPQSINFVLLFGVVIVLSTIMYNVQRLSPFFYMIGEKNFTFISRPEELLANPFQNIRNIYLIPYYISSEMGYVIAILGVIGLFFLFKKDRRLFTYTLLWIVLPYIAICIFNKVLFPRYIIFFATWMLLLAAICIASLKNKRLIIASWVAVVLSVAYMNYTLLFDPAKVPFPQVDRGQYIEGWPAGWGIKEIIEMAREEAKTRPVLILAEGNFGMAADVLRASTRPSDTDIAIDGKWPLGREQLLEAQKELVTKTVYLVFPHRTEYPSDWPVEFVKEFDKPGDESKIYLYKLLPEPSE